MRGRSPTVPDARQEKERRCRGRSGHRGRQAGLHPGGTVSTASGCGPDATVRWGPLQRHRWGTVPPLPVATVHCRATPGPSHRCPHPLERCSCPRPEPRSVSIGPAACPTGPTAWRAGPRRGNRAPLHLTRGAGEAGLSAASRNCPLAATRATVPTTALGGWRGRSQSCRAPTTSGLILGAP